MKTVERPDHLLSYCKASRPVLTVVTLSGLLYNIGLVAGPYFEGKMAQRLYEILSGTGTARDMWPLAVLYVAVILFVQGMRCLKRFYVRRFANNTARAMRGSLYANLVGADVSQSTGEVMTRAVSDVDECAEGMRKFVTELFDTGVALCAYLGMLFVYDWHLALLSCAFTPLAYLAAARMKKLVTGAQRGRKLAASSLNDATLDRASNALLYRVTGLEKNRDQAYASEVNNYRRKATAAAILETVPQPIYGLISLLGVVFILYFGGRNVLGIGWTSWDIAAFTAFLSCFARMAQKSSKAAKLFNAVQKAQVSWARVKPYLKKAADSHPARNCEPVQTLTVSHLSFSYPDAPAILRDVSFTLQSGEILGVTGAVGCGKSTLGKTLLGELPYTGSIRLDEAELSSLPDDVRCRRITYLGHESELLWDSVAENIRLGGEGDASPTLQKVQLSDELSPEDDVGSDGCLLSGGQRARVALGRTLYHASGLLILDDPFAALDRSTENAIFEELHLAASQHPVVLISHRLAHFPQLSRILYLENGTALLGTHDDLMAASPGYARLYRAQLEGGKADA
jgi:ATP-binding cassette subfamily B multidrug efflux pump